MRLKEISYGKKVGQPNFGSISLILSAEIESNDKVTVVYEELREAVNQQLNNGEITPPKNPEPKKVASQSESTKNPTNSNNGRNNISKSNPGSKGDNEKTKLISGKQRVAMFSLARKVGIADDKIESYLKKNLGLRENEPLKNATMADASKVIENLINLTK